MGWGKVIFKRQFKLIMLQSQMSLENVVICLESQVMSDKLPIQKQTCLYTAWPDVTVVCLLQWAQCQMRLATVLCRGGRYQWEQMLVLEKLGSEDSRCKFTYLGFLVVEMCLNSLNGKTLTKENISPKNEKGNGCRLGPTQLLKAATISAAIITREKNIW